MAKINALAACLSLAIGLSLAHAGGEEVDLGGLKSKAPASWKAQKAENKFRKYQFTIPKAEGDKDDAELVIFFFGKGSGGTVKDNVSRWKGMFTAPEGKTLDEVSKLTTFKIAKDVEVSYFDVSGTYKFKNPPFDPKAKEERRENYRLIGVIIDNDEGPFFIRMTGPAKTMAKNKEAFDSWIKAFK